MSISCIEHEDDFARMCMDTSTYGAEQIECVSESSRVQVGEVRIQTVIREIGERNVFSRGGFEICLQC